MNFYCIIRSLEDPKLPRKSLALLKQACESRGVNLISIESAKISFLDLPRLTSNDMLYHLTVDEKSVNLFNNLLPNKPITFHRKDLGVSPVAIQANGWNRVLAIKTAAVPTIPAIIQLTRDRDALNSYVQSLGGYPVVIKIQGGSHGIGVIKVDSQDSLFSLVDFLSTLPKIKPALMKYVDYTEHARLIVIGDQVVDSIEYKRVLGDFRSNVGEPTVTPRKFSPEIERAAIEATHASGFDFGGVDILIDESGFYVAEVNSPCNFARCQNLTGVDIAGKMIDFLSAGTKKSG